MAVLKHELSLNDSNFKSGINEAKKATQEYKGSLDGLNNTLGNTVSQTAKFKRETKKAQDQVQSFEKNIGSLKGSLGGMISSLSSGDIMGFASNIKNATMSVKGLAPAFMGATTAVGGTTTAVGGLGAAINLALGPIGLAVAAIGAVVAVSVKAIQVTEEFNKNLKDLSALTGMAGQDLEEVGDMAKDMGMKFGKSANDIIQSMMLIGSQAPELLKDKDALGEVTEAAIVLSKAAGIEVTDAAKGLTTVMNQMGVSASEATNIINSLAAGSQQGAGDVAYLQAAIEKCGTVAADSGMSYQQLIGTIETLAPKFSSADVAGSALKGTLLKLTTQANDDFNPAVVGLSKALENLDKANLSAADKVKLFGSANVTAASILIKNREQLDQLTEAVSDTNTAYDQMNAKSGQLSQVWDELCVACENLFTTIGQSKAMQFITKEIYLLIEGIKFLIQWIEFAVDFWSTFYEVVSAIVSKIYNNYVKPVFEYIGKAITNSAIFKKAKELWQSLVKVVTDVIRKVKELWNKFLDWLGIGGKKDIAVDAKVNIDVDTSDVDTKLENFNASGGNIGGGRTAKVTTKVEEEIISGSLKDIQTQIADVTKQITLIDPNDVEQIEILKKRLEDLKSQEYDLQVKLGLKEDKTPAAIVEGSLKDIQNKISEVNEQLQIVDPNNLDEIQKLRDELDKLTGQEHELKIKLGFETEKATKDTSPLKGSLADIENQISELQGKLKVVDPNNKAQIDEINSQLQDLLKQKYEIEVKLGLDKKQAKKTFSDITSEISSGIKTAYSYADSIKSIGDKLNELKNNEDATAWDWISFAADAASKLIETIGGVSKALEAMGVVTESTSAIQSAASKQAQADNIAETSTELALTGAESGEAIAGATKSGAKLPFPMNIAAIAAGIAAVVAALAMISKFKDGGIVPKAQNGMICSGSYCGDKNLVRVNGGEMILNGTQQASLFRMLNRGGVSSGGSLNGKVSFEISGKSLKGVLDNYNSKINKVK